MCTRFALFRWPAALAGLPGFPADAAPHWNLQPGGRVLMLRAVSGELRVDEARWGLTPAWLTDLSRTPAHARLETLEEQPMFREAWRARRCLVPANGFFEWRGVRKRPYWLTASEPLLYLAGIWEAYPVQGREYLSLALITHAAGAQRRPLLLADSAHRQWLDNPGSPAQLLDLLHAPQPALRERALAGLLNDPQQDGPECLTPA
jgi:putative SOS response-associated peptidase YedK